MSKDTEVVRTYFAKLGLEPEIADIYLALHANGPQSISELSRTSGVERTRIYRLIDQLMESNLIEVETQYKRGIIRAAPISNLNILISRREQELQGLQDGLELIEQVLGRNTLSSPTSRIQFYQGPEGVKQTYWNQTKAKNLNHVSILYSDMQSQTGQAFFNRWVQALNERGISSRSIVSDHFLESLRSWRKNHNESEQVRKWSGHYISPEEFTITHDVLVYDDVVGLYNWKGGEVFAMEIYNAEIAHTQRQMFELLWKASRPVEPGDVEPK